MNTTFTTSVELTTCTCGMCGGVYAINETKRAKCQQEGTGWHCPYCECSWGYFKDNDNAKLKRQVEALEQEKVNLQAAKTRLERDKELIAAEAEHFRKSRNITRGLLHSVKARVKNGVCPCCKRTFCNLASHMKTKHPGFALPKEEETKAE